MRFLLRIKVYSTFASTRGELTSPRGELTSPRGELRPGHLEVARVLHVLDVVEVRLPVRQQRQRGPLLLRGGAQRCEDLLQL
eukprot:2007996-Pyramimonas_sp.AAC.1